MSFYRIPMIIQAKVSLDRVSDFLRKVRSLFRACYRPTT